jgi:hypothetical protein
MKKQFLKFAFITAIVATVAAGCSSSEKAAGAGDSTSMDSSATMSTPTTTDSTARDTSRSTDTTKTNPPQ